MKGSILMENIQSTDLFKVIGKNIKYYRSLYNLEKGKMTQEKLAELADVSTALIANVESDKINQGISVFTLWKISKALEIPVENLFNGIDKDNHSLRA
jgi:toxin-antitoxin system, antitoxin component, xre family